MYGNVKSLCNTPETNITLYINNYFYFLKCNGSIFNNLVWIEKETQTEKRQDGGQYSKEDHKAQAKELSTQNTSHW